MEQSEKNIYYNTLEIDNISEINLGVIERGDYALAYRNMARCLEKQFDTGLIRWRRGESPISDMRAALYTADEMVRAVSKWQIDGDSLVGMGEAWSLVCYISYFLDTYVDLPGNIPSLVRAGREQYADVALDYRILDAIEGRAWQDRLDEPLQRLGMKKRQMLAMESYRTYFALLETRGEAEAADNLVRAAEVNYNRRARDAFYDGGPAYMGGGPDNPYVVDFVLAAIMKHIRWSGQSVHKWVW